MVRLMRWMIGFILTSLSSTLRAQYNNEHSGQKKLSSKDDDIGPGDVATSQFYDEPLPFLQTPTSWKLNDSTVKDLSLQHLMELPKNHCIENAIDDFPPDFLDEKQRSKGWIILHVLLGIYACYGIATICDTYFVPSLQYISDRLGLSSDVAGATFMAAGTSSPELFESIIGSFITEGDIGVGTIVGSAVFNLLAVTSVCGLFAGKMVPLDWWPLTRDCVFYTFSVVALIIVIYDGKIFWYESTALLIMFVCYVVLMRFNKRLSNFFHSFRCFNCQQKEQQIANDVEINHSLMESQNVEVTIKQPAVNIVVKTTKENGVCNKTGVNAILLDENKDKLTEESEENDYFSPFHIPEGCINKIIYFIAYPINLLFFLTVPNCARPGWERLYPLTFLMSVAYIGSLSYFVAWMVTVIGFTVGVPDTVMGITFLAIGTSVPEGYSSVIVCRKGMGNMAISNSVGSNVFDILFCLGLPWLIKATAFSTTGYVQINSSGLVYSAICLLSNVILLYIVIAVFKFRLNVKVGATCLLLYMVFLVLASLVEMNIFGEVNPPSCLF